MMPGSKRIVVMSPQTRLAHSRRRSRGRWRAARLSPAEGVRAADLFHAQRRRGAVALSLLFVLLFGLPIVFVAFPWLDVWRLLGIPVSWLMLAWLPYPAMVLLALWQLRRAERAEER